MEQPSRRHYMSVLVAHPGDAVTTSLHHFVVEPGGLSVSQTVRWSAGRFSARLVICSYVKDIFK